MRKYKNKGSGYFFKINGFYPLQQILKLKKKKLYAAFVGLKHQFGHLLDPELGV